MSLLLTLVLLAATLDDLDYGDLSFVTGRVVELGTRKPVAGAFIFRESALLSMSESDGEVHAYLREGRHLIRVTAAGYELFETIVEVAPGGARQRFAPWRLVPAATFESTVRPAREHTSPARVEIPAHEARAAAGTSGDPLRVVGLLPGVASVGYGAAAPVVRGTQPAATAYLVDGVRVPYLNHLLLGPSVVHPEFLDSITFHPGAVPLRVGRATGGLVDARSGRAGDALRVVGNVDLVNAGLFVEVPALSTGTQITAAARASYSAFAAALASDLTASEGVSDTTMAVGDYQLRVEQPVGDGRLRLFALGSRDDVDLGAQALVERPRARSEFHRLDVRWQGPLAGGMAEAAAMAGAADVSIEGHRGAVKVLAAGAREVTFGARARWTRPVHERLSLDVGAEVERRRGDIELLGLGGTLPDRRAPLLAPEAIGTFSGTYAELSWKPEPAVLVVGGVRADLFHVLPDAWIDAYEPRLTLRLDMTPALTMRTGFALQHQPPTLVLPLPAVELAAVGGHGLQTALHTTFGAEWHGEGGLEIAGDVYLNDLDRTEELRPLDVFDPRARSSRPTLQVASDGNAYGVELLVRKAFGTRWHGWVAYGLQRSTRRTHFYEFDDENRQRESDVAYLPFAFEQRHVLNATGSVRLTSTWTAGATLHLNSGRPESGELSSRTRVLSPAGTWRRVALDEADRLPAFLRLDLRVARTFRFDDFVLEGYLDLYNATVAREVLGYDYLPAGLGLPARKEPIEYGLLVLPMLGVRGAY